MEKDVETLPKEEHQALLRTQLADEAQEIRFLEAEIETRRTRCNEISRQIEWTAQEIIDREG